MRSRPPVLRDISDTARWVAMYRARETDRPDARFRDPYARLLAGERGEEILRRMPGERPRCSRESVKMDLSDLSARRAFLARIAAPSRKAVVVTEGFLAYLAEEDVASLARDLHDQIAFRWWITDLASPLLLKRLRRSYRRVLAEANAPLRFAPGEGTGFFAKYGWNEAEFRSTWEESRRLKREMPMAWLFRLLARLASTQRREMFRRLGATVLLERHVVS